VRDDSSGRFGHEPTGVLVEVGDHFRVPGDSTDGDELNGGSWNEKDILEKYPGTVSDPESNDANSNCKDRTPTDKSDGSGGYWP